MHWSDASQHAYPDVPDDQNKQNEGKSERESKDNVWEREKRGKKIVRKRERVKDRVKVVERESERESWPTTQAWLEKMLTKLSVSHMHRPRVRYSADRWGKRHKGKIGRSSFSNSHLRCPPLQTAAVRRTRTKGYLKADPWTVQTSLDQWPAESLPLRAKQVRSGRRKQGEPSFQWESREVRRAEE